MISHPWEPAYFFSLSRSRHPSAIEMGGWQFPRCPQCSKPPGCGPNQYRKSDQVKKYCSLILDSSFNILGPHY